MQKRSYYFNNPSSELIRITELTLSMPPGISNLFELNEELSYEQIEHSIKNGTLRAAIENGLCYPIPSPDNQRTFSDDVLIRKPLQLQVLPSRARFTLVQNPEPTIFDATDNHLFDDEEMMPARQLEEQLKTSAENVEQIEATIKQANLDEKPIENRYVPPPVRVVSQEKIKNDAAMGYVTCNGSTVDNKKCMRRAKKGRLFCGLHTK